MKKLLMLLALFAVAPLAMAKWVRFEAEDAVLSSTHAQIQDYADASGGKAVFLTNGPAGTIDFGVNVREPNSFAMRIGFYSNDNVSQKYDTIFVNGNEHMNQNWACGYYWDPVPKPANFEDYRDSIETYGTGTIFQVLSRWWPAWWDGGRNIPMTIPLEAGYNIIQIQSGWSMTTYDYIELDLPDVAINPAPADGDLEVRSTQSTLSWTNPAGITKNILYFGQSDTEPNAVDYKTKLTSVVTLNNPSQTPSVAMPTALVDGKDYYWVVDGYNTPAGEPNFPGVIWHFGTQFHVAPTVSIQAPLAYLGQGGVPGEVTVSLDATITPPGAMASYAWTYVSGAASVSKSATDLAALTGKWWGEANLNSATVIDQACQYSVELSGNTFGWGEQIRLVNWNDGGLQVGNTWRQRFVCPATNPYSVEVAMYYTVTNSPTAYATAVLDPGTEVVLGLPITEAVSNHGIQFTTGFNVGTYPTVEGATGTVLIDAYHVDPVLPVIHSPTTEDTTVTLYETGHPYLFQLIANDGVRDGAGTVAFHVGNTGCQTSLATPGNPRNVADIDGNCLVNLKDFAELASDWLKCLDTLTGNNCN